MSLYKKPKRGSAKESKAIQRKKKLAARALKERRERKNE